MPSYQVPVRYGESRALKPATALGDDATERCDACRARAYVLVVHPSSDGANILRLALCSHHFNCLHDGLRASGWDVEVDARHLLTGEHAVKVSVTGGAE